MASTDKRNKNSNWIQSTGINQHKGALHRALGVPMGQKIPASKLASAAHGDSKLAKRARLAQTLRKLG